MPSASCGVPSSRSRTYPPHTTRASFVLLFVLLWQILFQLNPGLAVAQVPPPDPAPTFSNDLGGQWGPVIEWPHVPVSIATLPDGRLLTFASNEPNRWPGSTTDEYTHAAVWDPETGSITSIPNPGHDMFCAAIVMLEDGEVFVMGGRNGAASPWVSYFDFHENRWVQFDAADDMNLGRWYPTAVYLGSGEVFVVAGTGGGIHPEVWSSDGGWTLKTGIDISDTMLSLGARSGAGTWPLVQLAPDGSIFHHGATATMNRIEPFAGPGGLGTMTDLGPHNFGWYPDEGISVTYDEGKLLVAGGSRSSTNSVSSEKVYLIDINGPGPVLTPGTPMHFPRQFMNEVLLPNGDVIAVGGNTNGRLFDDDFAIRNPETWDRDTGLWTLMNPQDQARTYHSTAALLLDGRVVSAGGGLDGDLCTGLGSPGECGVDHWNAEIFSPPYLFAPDGSPAIRPEIQSAPGVARVGLTITVHATPGLSDFSLIRMSGTTHTMNTDQRFLNPSFVETAPGIYDVTLHANEHVLVPGYWMLFAMDGEVPSVAKALHVVNDGLPRGSPVSSRQNDVGDPVLFEIDLEDPDGNPISYFASNLPTGLTIDPLNGQISGTTSAAGLYNVQILAMDGTDPVDVHFPWIVSAVRSELGTVAVGDWTTVNLDNQYEEPIVVAGLASSTDLDPVTVRVRNVTSTSFEIRVEEWPYLDGIHAVEAVSYLVVEAGEYRLSDGAAFVAGIAPGIDDLNPWMNAFTPSAFVSTPVVVTQVASTSAGPSSPASTARVDAVSTAGFTVQIQDQEAGLTNLPPEDIHWIAFEPTAIPGLIEGGFSAAGVDENVTSVVYGQGFAEAPHVFARTQSLIELDPGTLRVKNVSTAGFDVFFQEETSLDPEVAHLPETVGWLAIEPAASTLGLLPLFNEPPSIVTPSDQQSVRDDLVSLSIDAIDPDGGSLTFSASGLPTGLSIDPTTGVVAGSVTTVGTFVATLVVTDPSGDADEANFVWTVEERLEIEPTPTPPEIEGVAVDFFAETTLAGNFEYTWNFGDGSAPDGPHATPGTSHTFAEPGRYFVQVTVVDPVTGEQDTHQFVQVITGVPTQDAPRASSSIISESAENRVWVVNPDQHTVSVIDTSDDTVMAEIPVANGPRTLAIAGDGKVWVASKEGSAISIIDPWTFTVIDTLTFHPGAAPHGITFDPAGTVAFVVFEQSGEVKRLDGLTGAELTTQVVGPHVRHIAITADAAKVYLPRFVSPPLPGESAGSPVTEVAGLPVGAEIMVLDASTLQAGIPITLAVSTELDSSVAARGLPNYLGAPSVSPDGGALVVPSKQDNIYRGDYRDAQALTHDQTVRAITSRVDLVTNLEVLASRVDHDDSSIASATAYTPLGAYLIAALQSSREIAVIDPFTSTELARLEVGRAPAGLAVSDDGRSLYVHNYMDRSVSVFDMDDLVDFGDSALPLAATVDLTTSELLSSEVLLGKQLFYDARDPRLARDRYMSCSVCHSEGGQDGRVWDFHSFGEGLRNTTDLRGHGTGMGRLHWTGNFDEFQDFENQIRILGGTGLMSEADFAATSDLLGPPKAGLSADLDSLAAYLASLVDSGESPHRENDGSLTPEAVAGQVQFTTLGCASCHLGAEFTDSDQLVSHDVGTLGVASGPQSALDTPTLRGLWASAPYLHDGSAGTLEDAIAAHSGVATTPAQRAELAAYLLEIDENEVAAPNATPQVNLTLPTDGSSVEQNLNVAFGATASDSEEGDLTATIIWTSSQDGEIGIGASFQRDDLSVGVHVITATVTDSQGESGSDSVNLTITGNAVPVLTVTAPVDGALEPVGASVSFAATASDLEDGDLTASISWSSDLDGALGTGGSFSSNALQIGTHVITALVADSLGAEATDQISLTVVLNDSPTLLVESPQDLATFNESLAITFAATASDTEDGDISNDISWLSSLDGALGTGGSLTLDTLQVGTHVITVEVTDSLGAEQAVMLSLTIDANQPPTMSILSPEPGYLLPELRPVELVGTGLDSEEGDISALISWASNIDGPLGAGATLTVPSLSIGTHLVTASVTDSLGAPATDEVSIVVSPNTPPNVIVVEPVGYLEVPLGAAIAFEVDAIDLEDGNIDSSAVWTSSLDGEIGTGSEILSDSLSEGIHEVSVSAIDSHGAEGLAQVVVAVPEPGLWVSLFSGVLFLVTRRGTWVVR